MSSSKLSPNVNVPGISRPTTPIIENTIEITVSDVKATQLAKTGLFGGKPNPFAVITLENQKRESSVCVGTNNAHWKTETFTFTLRSAALIILDIQIHNKPKGSASGGDFHSGCTQSIDFEDNVRTRSYSHKLSNRKGQSAGAITFTVSHSYIINRSSETLPGISPPRYTSSPAIRSDSLAVQVGSLQPKTQTEFMRTADSLTSEDAGERKPASPFSNVSSSRARFTTAARADSGSSSDSASLDEFAHASIASSHRKTPSILSSPPFLGQDIPEDDDEVKSHNFMRTPAMARIASSSSSNLTFSSDQNQLSPSLSEKELTSEGFIIPSVRHAEPQLAERIRALSSQVEAKNATSNSLGEAANSLATLINFFDRIAQSNVFALIAWSAVATALKAAARQKDYDETVADICKQIRDMLVFARNVNNLHQLEGGMDILSGLLTAVEGAANLIDEYLKVPWRTRVTKGVFWDKWGPRIASCKKDLEYWHKLFDRTVNIEILHHVGDISTGIADMSNRMVRMENHVAEIHGSSKKDTRDHNKVLNTLPRIHHAMYDRVKMCAKGTRMELLDDLMQWAQSTDPDAAQIYWLNGQAGMGKSTIASTFSNLLKEQHKLGGDFFFSRSVAERSITQGVFVTIAYQLATRIPGIKDAICDAVEEEPDVGNLAVSTQWKSLIKGPLLKSAANLGVGFVIVMDALDECIAPLEIIENIESDISSLPPAFKIFCTSRPENNLEVAFKALGQRVKEYPLSATDANVTRDIRTFITERMKRISRKYDLEDDEEWPGDERRETLVRKAAGLFIWVTTASEFIEDDEVGDPEGQLQVILDDVIEPHAATSPWHSLDSLYIQVLRQALSERAPDFRRKLYHQVVGAIVTIRNPLSVSALAHLLDIQAHGGNSATKLVEQTIGKIRAVLFIPKSEHDVIRTIHKSFADFLTNRERCTDERLYIDPVLQHQYLATRCLQIMDQLLTPYICDIDPSLLNSDIDDFKSRYLKHIPPALRYACTFWGEHLHSSFPIPALFPLVKKFYNHHLLAWLEVLSLTGLVDSGPGTLAMAYKWLGKHYNKEPELCALAEDSHRFVVEFRDPIEQSAAHVRYSALPLSPRNLPVYKTYASKIKPDAYKILYGPPLTWPGWDVVMDRHTDSVYSLTFSPSGSQVASGSEDMTLRIWDTESRTAVGNEFAGHEGTVTALVFELDGKYIISGSLDGTLRRWNVSSGDAVGMPFVGHTAAVTSVALSSEGGVIKLLISGSQDGSIRSWDIKSHAGTIMCQHPGGVTCLAFAPGGDWILSGSVDGIIRKWDSTSGAAIGDPLNGHTRTVCSVAFSPDGSRFVSGSDDETLRLWDAHAIKPEGKVLSGHAGPVFSVAFSPDGKLIGSGSQDATVRLWNATTGNPVSKALTQPDAALAIAFSADSGTLMAAIYDFSIRVWDVQRQILPEGVEGGPAKDNVLSVNWSHDGKRIVAGSASGSIEVFDSQSRKSLLHVSKGHRGPIYTAIFSPDDSLILTTGYDKTVHQWDAFTGKEVRKVLEGHVDRVFSGAYSADGKRAVSGGRDNAVRVWDAVEGKEIACFYHDDRIYYCTYSPDGIHVASGARDGSLRVWKIETGEIVWEINETKTIILIEYTRDGKNLLATTIEGKSIFLNVETGSREQNDLFTRSLIFDLETGWLKDYHERRLCWLPSEYRADFRPGVFGRHFLATPNVSQDEPITIFDLSWLMARQVVT